MNCENTMCGQNGASVGQVPVAQIPQRTVREDLDRRIKNARQQVEDLCILKAKADTVGILDYPHEFITNLVF